MEQNMTLVGLAELMESRDYSDPVFRAILSAYTSAARGERRSDAIAAAFRAAHLATSGEKEEGR